MRELLKLHRDFWDKAPPLLWPILIVGLFGLLFQLVQCERLPRRDAAQTIRGDMPL